MCLVFVLACCVVLASATACQAQDVLVRVETRSYGSTGSAVVRAVPVRTALFGAVNTVRSVGDRSVTRTRHVVRSFGSRGR